ncbi:sensor histidine kinase [Pseudonocardia sp. KRD291]|uniref:sensor histidine kinase n=1 Tax=Pseudonocardia sp. KRD291 TaxID=2792007 RepID=UPI001C5C2E0B|nr:histidine kinase [Pseudonocardia sp. KRD291]MBW0105200.1 two-component sensor histidine kinase [Pseudonocardia sp. KRD291]
MSSPRPDGPAVVGADVTPGLPDRFSARLDAGLTRMGLTGDFRRDCALALVVLVVSGGLVAGFLTDPAQVLLPGISPAQAGAAIAVTAAQSLLLCLRRRSPVVCLWLITLLQLVLFVVLPAGGSINGVAPFVAAYTCGALLAARRTVRVIAGVTFVEGAGFALRTLLPGQGADTLTAGLTPAAALTSVAGVVVTSLLTHVAAAVFGAYVATRRRYVELVRVRAAEAIEVQRARADAAIGLERSRMARELHDIAAHHLSGMVVQAAVVEKLIDRDPEAAKQAAAWVRGQGKETLHNLRLVVGALREPGNGVSDDAPVPGLGVLDRLLGTARELGTPVEFVQVGEPPELAPIADVTFYRVAQEALSNARDHAPGAPVRVLLRHDEAGVSLEVTNDAAPPSGPADADRPTTSHRGLGLVGMNERAQMIGATLRTGPDPSGGWRVVLRLPPDPDPDTAPPAQRTRTHRR